MNFLTKLALFVCCISALQTDCFFFKRAGYTSARRLGFMAASRLNQLTRNMHSSIVATERDEDGQASHREYQIRQIPVQLGKAFVGKWGSYYSKQFFNTYTTRTKKP